MLSYMGHRRSGDDSGRPYRAAGRVCGGFSQGCTLGNILLPLQGSYCMECDAEGSAAVAVG